MIYKAPSFDGALLYIDVTINEVLVSEKKILSIPKPATDIPNYNS
jgi:hypothetical protein